MTADLLVFILDLKIVFLGASYPILFLISCMPRGVLKEFSALPSPNLEEEIGKLFKISKFFTKYSLCSLISTTIEGISLFSLIKTSPSLKTF